MTVALLRTDVRTGPASEVVISLPFKTDARRKDFHNDKRMTGTIMREASFNVQAPPVANVEAPALRDFLFGPFRLQPSRRLLLKNGQPVEVGSRALDLLTVLVEQAGKVLHKEQIMDRVWPGRVVEDNALQSQISALRSALGPERGLIRTVSGRGYQFTGTMRSVPVTRESHAFYSTIKPETVGPLTNLLQPLSELIGRTDETSEVQSLAAAHRLVTFTGPGGAGKTRLALAVAHRLLPRFPDGVWLAEFSSISDPSLVPGTVAAAIGLDLGAGQISPQRVGQALAGRQLLLVLETCEHVIDAVAAFAEAVLQSSSTVRILATSREPLRVEGERRYAVPPLAVSADGGEDPWQSPAVRLFVTRLRASGTHVAEDAHVAAVVATICRQLEGNPLAIELAAMRAASLGIEALAACFDDRFRLLNSGQRTALPRHQSLRATLDWSHQLLAKSEQIILRRLSSFAGSFSLEAASAVAADAEIVLSDVVESVSNLVAKSLICLEFGAAGTRYRLPETMRAYAREKLAESGERDALARRHAEYFSDLHARAGEGV